MKSDAQAFADCGHLAVREEIVASDGALVCPECAPEPDPPEQFVLWARCCRWWPVMLFMPIGRCGYCGERPVVQELEESDPK